MITFFFLPNDDHQFCNSKFTYFDYYLYDDLFININRPEWLTRWNNWCNYPWPIKSPKPYHDLNVDHLVHVVYHAKGQRWSSIGEGQCPYKKSTTWPHQPLIQSLWLLLHQGYSSNPTFPSCKSQQFITY